MLKTFTKGDDIVAARPVQVGVIRLLFDTNTMIYGIYITSFKIIVILFHIKYDQTEQLYVMCI